jgi:tetratricopeptide (TPR) repeat protein
VTRLLLIIALLACASVAARADDVPDRARELARRGRFAYAGGNYAGAALAFEDALALAPSKPLLFDLAQSYRLSGRCERAATYYSRYLATDPEPELRSLAQAHLVAMEQCVAGARRPVAALSPANVSGIDDTRGRTTRDTGLGLAITGGAAIAASIYFAVEAHDASDAVSRAYADGASGAAVIALDARGHRDARLGTAFGIAGAAAAGTGAVLYYLGRREARDAIAITPATRGAEVHVQWRF